MTTTAVPDAKVVSREEWLHARTELLAQEKQLHSTAGRHQRRAPCASLAQSGEGVCLRYSQRKKNPGRSLRRPQPADRLSLHVETRPGQRLQRLLFSRRPHRRRQPAPGPSRREPGCNLPRAAFCARSVQAADGLAFSHGYRRSTAISTSTIMCRSRRKNWPAGRSFITTGRPEHRSTELSGISVFYQAPDGEIFHTYSSYGRGNEEVLGAYMYLDLTPKGRNENGPNHNMGDWVVLTTNTTQAARSILWVDTAERRPRMSNAVVMRASE